MRSLPNTCTVGAVSALRVVRLVAGNARLVAANPQLRRVLVAWGVGIAGEWAFLVVLSVTAYERGGAAAVGIVGAVRVLPAALGAYAGAAGAALRGREAVRETLNTASIA